MRGDQGWGDRLWGDRLWVPGGGGGVRLEHLTLGKVVAHVSVHHGYRLNSLSLLLVALTRGSIKQVSVSFEICTIIIQ